MKIKSPNRPSGEYVHALLNEALELEDSDFKEIEKAGCCKLEAAQKEKIRTILDSFCINEALHQEYYTRGELADYLKKISDAAKILSDILADHQNHAIRTACFKMDDEFESAIGNVGFEMHARWDLVQKYYCGDLELSLGDQIDYRFLADNCLLMTEAADLALSKMNENIKNDQGGREKSLSSNLFLELDNILDQAQGQNKARERFIIKCVNFIPEKQRPHIPGGAGSILANIKRANPL